MRRDGKLNSQDIAIGILTSLGLTVRQAEVYLAITQLEEPTVKSIAQAARIARAAVYRVIPMLQKLGLIQKIISIPNTYKGLPLSEGISILLEQETEQHKETQAKVKEFLQNIKNRSSKKLRQENTQCSLIYGLKAVTREYLKSLQKIQKSKDCILKWKAMLYLLSRDFRYIDEALEKGVKIRYITHIPESEKAPHIIKTLTKKGNFEIKTTSAMPKIEIDIFDAKIVHFINVQDSAPKEIEVLRLENPAVADLLQDYFELKWQLSATPQWSS